MEFAEGMIIKSVKGHDAGEYFLAVKTDEQFVYIANGKTRRIASPKKKNKKHIVVTDAEVQSLEALTDKSLRKLISKLKTI